MNREIKFLEPKQETESDDSVIQKLATLSQVEYDRVRKEKAKELGIQLKTLDQEVSKLRRPEEDSTSLFEELEPWPEAVEIGPLLSEIRDTLDSYIVFQDGATTALPLWIACAYAYEPLRIFPKLMVVSPEKRCGKTTLMEVIEALAPRTLMASGISPAVVYRVIEAHKPTLLIDEADRILPNNPELHGIINSGHTKKGASILRCDGDNNEPRRFSTWSPMVLAGIKLAGDTIIDRSVVIQLRRKVKGETVESLPVDLPERKRDLRRKLTRWAADNSGNIAAAIRSGRSSSLPDIGNDRALDNWTPLAAVAKLAGGEWINECAHAFQKLTPEDQGEAIGAMLLEDIQSIFRERAIDRMWCCDLADALVELEERPWPEWKHGKPMTVRSLANLLRGYEIKSVQLKDGVKNRNGFQLEQFKDAFERYLSEK